MLKYIWRRFVVDRLVEAIRYRINYANAREFPGFSLNPTLEGRLKALEAELARTQAEGGVLTRNQLHLPDLLVHPAVTDFPFMAASSCSARDFLHPDFSRLSRLLNLTPSFHRKIWEYVFILHHLQRFGLMREGARGLGFGVGAEPLPSCFAAQGVKVTATDAPVALGQSAGWVDTIQHVSALDQIHMPELVDRATFDENVSFRPCDMRAIDPDLNGYDFVWSACCFEHLGNLRNGLDFVRESVEKTLRVGGVAVHTTELNLQSDEHTIETADTVLYRRRDFEGFVAEMRERGHQVDEFKVAPDSHWADLYVDLPPYKENPHLKLQMQGVLTTSAGVVITRGV